MLCLPTVCLSISLCYVYPLFVYVYLYIMLTHCLFVDIFMLCLITVCLFVCIFMLCLPTVCLLTSLCYFYPQFAVLDAPDALLIEPDVSSITVSWESPEGGYTGFEVDCLANSDAAVDQSTNKVEESDGTYTAACGDVTSGVEYTVTVTTLHDDHDMRSEGTTNYTITGRWNAWINSSVINY